ncbi:hypothetical protein HYH02_006963 [Chlamydomonas schloesseri]|uniref:Uncharacterized protein n=1 Tax=Chlamydomonas schloesseri TaxID=2026947 RepID=A0A835WJS6_9CHLO|nr:hypothetical protein HYH02_006963 [Chlamydomonas schloesseri]|eukprot:KAG2448381.1 hypothetical protein HYH02_006963 [Chlamydomonas schloesseri]
MAGEPAKTSSAYWRWALAAGVPVAWYLYSRGRKPEVERTDIDAFFKAPEPVGSTGSRPAGGGLQSGPIDAFFRDAGEEVDTRNPLDFDSFLVAAKRGGAGGKAAAAGAGAAAPAKPKESGPSPDMKPVTVLYGTEYGFSKEIAEKLCAQLKAAGCGLWPQLENMADHAEGYDFSKAQVALLACSTQGDGVPPTEAREFCEWLFAGKAGSLAHLQYAVCALGDKSYTHFCRCGKQLDSALEAAGAKRLVERVDVNKEDWPVVDAWVEGVVAAVRSMALKSFAELGLAVGDSGAAKAAAPKKWGKSRPYFATVLALEGLCTLSGPDDKNTVRMELDLGDSGISYLPGDALGLYPTNQPQGVEELLRVMGASPSEPVTVPSWHYEEEGVAPGGSMPLAQALTKCYDIRSPKPELIKLLVAALDASANGHAANGHAANGHANGHANGDSSTVAAMVPPQQRLREALKDQAATEAYLEPRHVVDVLADAAPAKLTTAQVLSCLRQLQPRLYSISSSPLEAAARVQVTVAEVKYLSLGKARIGVCSTMLSERLQVGARVPVYVHKNPDFRLPADPATPIIMVGPGTGLAPFRSFILERLLEAEAQEEAKKAPGEMVLYFGCRRSDQDYLYGGVLEGWAAEGKIRLFTAFSRQQAQKVYVQNRLAESADLVWGLLEKGAHFYVCGDASSMAGSVEKALLKLIGERLEAGPAGAEAYLQKLSDTGRYQRDVWY